MHEHFVPPAIIMVATIISVLVLCSTTDVRNKNNMTPLHYACRGGHKEVVKYFIQEVGCSTGKYSRYICGIEYL